jgi:hypothetical protein
MRLNLQYQPEVSKLSVHKRYSQYYRESVVLLLPVEAHLVEAQEVYVVTSRLDVETVSPLPTRFLGEAEVLTPVWISSPANLQLRMTLSYARLEELENDRKQLPNRQLPQDLTLKVKGPILLMTKEGRVENSASEVGQGKVQFITVRQEDWQAILEEIGYPRKKFLVLNEDVWNEIEKYRKLHGNMSSDDAILDALRRSERSS